MGKYKKKASNIWIKLTQHLKKDWYRYVFDTIVVILGILIAFSLDNWNESSSRRALTRAYATSLISDLQDDIEEVGIIQAEMREYIYRIDSLANYVRNTPVEDLSNLNLFPLLTGGNRPYSWNRVTIDDLKQSGVLRDKGNQVLSRMIAEYEALTMHMHEDYQVDLNNRERVSALADEIVNLNYTNFKQLAAGYWNPNAYHITTDNFRESEAYMEAQKDGLVLFTNDEARINQMVNGYLRLGWFLNIRANIELPELIGQAEEIITLLNENYLD